MVAVYILEQFYEALQEKIKTWNRPDYLIVSEDFNVQVGNNAVSGTKEYFGNNI